MSFKRIDSEVEKVVETYFDTKELTSAQQSALKDAFGHLADANLCLVVVAEHESDSGCAELVLANKDARSRYDERYFAGSEVDWSELRYLESKVVPLDARDLREKLEAADREVERVKRVLERQERDAEELRRQLIAQGPAKTLTPVQDRIMGKSPLVDHLIGQHAKLNRTPKNEGER